MIFLKGLRTMNRTPRIEIKTIPGVAEEIERHLDTEQTKEKKTVKKGTRKKAEAEKDE